MLIENGYKQSLCVVATAGSGKSTFMRQLQDGLVEQGHRCSWLNLDSRDDDPATLIPYLFEAFERLRDSSAVPLQRPLDFDDPASIRSAFSLLQRLVGKLRGKCALFLDDFHYLKNQEILEQVNHLLDVCADHVQLIIGSRVMPDLANFTTLALRPICSPARRGFEVLTTRSRTVFSCPGNSQAGYRRDICLEQVNRRLGCRSAICRYFNQEQSQPEVKFDFHAAR